MRNKIIRIIISNALYFVFLLMMLLAMSDAAGTIDLAGSGSVLYMVSLALLSVTMFVQFIFVVTMLSDPQATKFEIILAVSSLLLPLIPIGLAIWLLFTKWKTTTSSEVIVEEQEE